MAKAAQVDWTAIRQEYVTNPVIGKRTLAEKFGVSYDALRGRATRQHWLKERASFQQQYANRLQELALRKDAPQLLRELNEDWLKQSKELRYILNAKIKMRDASGQIVVRPDVTVNDVVRAIGGFSELYRMDRLALGASTDNLAPAFPENKYDDMSEDELIAELRRVRALSTIQ